MPTLTNAFDFLDVLLARAGTQLADLLDLADTQGSLHGHEHVLAAAERLMLARERLAEHGEPVAGEEPTAMEALGFIGVLNWAGGDAEAARQALYRVAVSQPEMLTALRAAQRDLRRASEFTQRITSSALDT